MPERERNLYESATQRMRIVRHLDIVCLIVDGAGAMIVPLEDFMPAQKWCSSRMASGNMLNDRNRLLDRLQQVVSRPGSIVPTRGDERALEKIARAMRAAGYDINEWALPPNIRNPPRPIDALGPREPGKDDEAGDKP